MATVTGGQLVGRMLKKEGVRHIFTLSGLHVAPIYAGCVEEGIQVIDTRHEQAAAHAADAYARVTRGVGVAVVTAGPGVTDALTGVANANAASSPMILLGGAAPIFNQSRGSLQEMEQVDLFHRISKWSDRVPTPELVPAYLAKAFRVALSGRPGPVFLELAWDVLCNGADEETLQHAAPATARTRASRRIRARWTRPWRCSRPPSAPPSSPAPPSTGTGPGTRCAASARRRRCPCTSTAPGRGCLPAGHPLFFQHTRKEALTGADVVFVIGTPFDFRLNYGAEPTFSSESKIVQVDIDPTEIGRNRAVEVGIIADSFSALEAFADAAPARQARHVPLRPARPRGQAAQGPGAVDEGRQRPHPPLPARQGDVRRGELRGTGSGVHRGRRQLGGHGRQGHRAAQAGPLAGSGAARVPGRGRAVRHRLQGAAPRAHALGHPGRRLVRPQRHGLRDGRALQAAHGVRGGQ